MKRTIEASGGEETDASGTVKSSATPRRTLPVTAIPALRNAERNAVAAASAGCVETYPPTRLRSTTSAESGGDSFR
jgi:hypothetical protein